MAKPEIHSESSVKKFGGKVRDYQPIHQMMDSSKAAYPNNMHRVVFHHAFGTFVMEKLFGIDFDAAQDFLAKYNLPPEALSDLIAFKDACTNNGTMRLNADERKFSVRDIAEQHCLEDFRGRFIPTLSDYCEHMQMRPWMNNAMAGDTPNRLKKPSTPAEDVANTKVLD